MRDYLIVAYRHGRTAMRRRTGGDWIDERLGPGDVSLLTRAAESRWSWPAEIEVVQVHLGQRELDRTCREMYEREVTDVVLRDEVKADDPAIHHAAMLIATRPRGARPGAPCWSRRWPASCPCTSCAGTRTCTSASPSTATG